MATEYKLSYTASEIDEKLRKIDNLNVLSENSKTLLINILKSCVFVSDQTENILALETELNAQENQSGICQVGNMLEITSGVSATQNNSTLAIL